MKIHKSKSKWRNNKFMSKFKWYRFCAGGTWFCYIEHLRSSGYYITWSRTLPEINYKNVLHIEHSGQFKYKWNVSRKKALTFNDTDSWMGKYTKYYYYYCKNSLFGRKSFLTNEIFIKNENV